MPYVVAVDGVGRLSAPDLASSLAMLGSLATGGRGAVWRILQDRAVLVASVDDARQTPSANPLRM